MNEVRNAYEVVNIKMVRGDTLQFNMEFEELASDLASAAFTIKDIPSESEVVISKTLNNGITKVSDGVYTVRLAPTDTSSKDAGTYGYDLQIGVGSDIYTLMIGKLILLHDMSPNM